MRAWAGVRHAEKARVACGHYWCVTCVSLYVRVSVILRVGGSLMRVGVGIPWKSGTVSAIHETNHSLWLNPLRSISAACEDSLLALNFEEKTHFENDSRSHE